MGRAMFPFFVGLAATLGIGVTALLLLFDSVPQRNSPPVVHMTRRAATLIRPPVPQPPDPVPMSWMPAHDYSSADLVVHVICDSPAYTGRRFNFPFVWDEYDAYPDEVLGGCSGGGDGRGPNGEGVGYRLSGRARVRPNGCVEVGIWSKWDLPGRVSGTAECELLVTPRAWIPGAIQTAVFGDGLVVRYWISGGD